MGNLRLILYKMFTLISMDFIFVLPLCFLISWVIFDETTTIIFFTATFPLYWRKLLTIVRTFRRDILYIKRLYDLISTAKYYEKRNMTVGKIFTERTLLNPDRTCCLFEDQVWTNQKVEDYSNRVANIFNEDGFKAGDSVALLMNNRPEYICIWLGLSKLGIISALINPNLKGPALTHCIEIVNSKAIIYHSEFSSVMDEICPPSVAKYIFVDDALRVAKSTDRFKVLNHLLQSAPCKLHNASHTPNYHDNMLYIYTSGTTGLPKAAIIRNSRYVLGGLAARFCCSLRDDDIVYNCLPLCHTSGGCLAAGLSLISGITTVIKSKFSASKYISDCNYYNATVGMYIGEMCRYILSSTKEQKVTNHNLRALIGNGLRPAVWKKLVDTFHIPEIYEFYGATEGNVNMANIDNKFGAVGCIPNLIPSILSPISLIRVNTDTGLPIRNSFGLCERCLPGEPGMLVGLIEPKDPTRHYAGYVNNSESQKKVIHNVFSVGDSAFASGDLLVKDELGYLYFKDRLGDTFRWKGENVSTCEVESVINSFPGLLDCVVYGVQVGDYEGRAGAAAIVENEPINLTSFATCLDNTLASYARPLFLRLLPSISMTSTFKLRKLDVEKLGIDPSLSPSDHRLLFRMGQTFVPLTEEVYSGIVTGKTRV